MARGLRSNRLKANKTKLRANVFGPVEDARTQRLAARLAAVAAAPAPARVAREAEMDVQEQGDKPATAEVTATSATSESAADDDVEKAEAMDIDGTVADPSAASKPYKKRLTRKEQRKVKKDKHRKEKNSITFKKKPTNPNPLKRRQPRI